MKKPTCTLYGGLRPPYKNVHVGFFSFIPQGNEKNQLSILRNPGRDIFFPFLILCAQVINSF